MDNSELRNKLSSINWNFDFTIEYEKSGRRPFNCREYYSYPATFIPEIPYALIEVLSSKGGVVLDPFGGIGTTFMQALSLEREPFSFDINPIATMVCKTLYKLFNPSIDKQEIKTKLLGVIDGYNSTVDYSEGLTKTRKELSGWFENNTFNEIAFLCSRLDDISGEIEKEVMELVLSSLLVTLSSQNKGWAYIADNVKPKEDEFRRKNVFDQYKLTVKNLLNDVDEYIHCLPETFTAFYNDISQRDHVFNDSLLVAPLKANSVDLIVTSPPYPRMIDYVKSQRLSFNFINENFNEYVGREIGARYRRSRRDCLISYENSIKEINSKITELMKIGGYLCLVLPDYDEQDNRKEVIQNIVEDYTKRGLTKVFEVGRYIPSHKRTLSIQWATLLNERIYIFQKG